MSRPDGTFEKIGRTGRPGYGPQKLLLCGFSRDARKPFASVLQTAGLGAVEASWLEPSHGDRRLAELSAERRAMKEKNR